MFDYVDQILIFAIFALSLNLLLGFAGQVSIAHAAFGAVGGYTVAYLSIKHGVALGPALLLGGVLACAIGGLVGIPALRLSEGDLILLTLAFQTLILSLVTNVATFGTTYGLQLDNTDLFGISVAEPSDFLVPALVCAAVTALVMARIAYSPYGRVLRGIRDEDVAVESLGKNVVKYKVVTFALTSGFAGIAGGLLAIYYQIASPGLFPVDQSITIIAMVIIGGTANLLGSLLGTTLIVLSTPATEWLTGASATNAGIIRLIIYGLALALVMLLRPAGILPEGAGRALRRYLGRKPEPPAAAPPPERAATPAAAASPPPGNGVAPAPVAAPPAPAPAVAASPVAAPPSAPARPALEVEGLSKSFGPIDAVRDVSFELPTGTITALVGPNGAGKTTIFSLLTGFIPPDRGSVRLGGHEVVGASPHRIARLGMVRSFQDGRLFGRLTARENVMLGVQGHAGEHLRGLFTTPGKVRRIEHEARERAQGWLEFVGLGAHGDEPMQALSFGDQKRAAIARVLAAEPDVLLLDEPTSGINPALVDGLLELVAEVAAGGRTVCIVEHNLEVVSKLAARAYFLELGRIVAAGSIEALMGDQHLVEVYFGSR